MNERPREDDELLRTTQKKRPREDGGAKSTAVKKARVVTPDDRFLAPRIDAETAFREKRAVEAGEAVGRTQVVGADRRREYRHQLQGLLSPNADGRVFARPICVSAERDASSTTSPRAAAAPAAPSLSRNFSSRPAETLDAPDIYDDFYCNTLSLSSTDRLGVGLGSNVYSMKAWNKEVREVWDLGCPVTSVAWAPSGGHIAVGGEDASLVVVDGERGAVVRDLAGIHDDRVGVLAWNPSTRTLATGGRDADVWELDLRIKGLACVRRFSAHSQEVCGLRWSGDGATLASGGNENLLALWDARSNRPQPLHALTAHRAAVKAIAWCPGKRHLLASGGGTADRTVKLWNTNTGALLHSANAGSQVTGLLWAKGARPQLLSSHGFSENQLSLWNWNSAPRRLDRVVDLRKHTGRVLALEASPDGARVASAGADELLCIWDVWDSAATAKSDEAAFLGGGQRRDVRKWDSTFASCLSLR